MSIEARVAALEGMGGGTGGGDGGGAGGFKITLLDVKNMRIEKFSGEDDDPTFFVKWIDSLRDYADTAIPGMARAMLKCETTVEDIDEIVVNVWAIPGITYDLYATMLYKFLKEHSK